MPMPIVAYKCKYCGRIYCTAESFITHKKTHTHVEFLALAKQKRLVSKREAEEEEKGKVNLITDLKLVEQLSTLVSENTGSPPKSPRLMYGSLEIFPVPTNPTLAFSPPVLDPVIENKIKKKVSFSIPEKEEEGEKIGDGENFGDTHIIQIPIAASMSNLETPPVIPENLHPDMINDNDKGVLTQDPNQNEDEGNSVPLASPEDESENADYLDWDTFLLRSESEDSSSGQSESENAEENSPNPNIIMIPECSEEILSQQQFSTNPEQAENVPISSEPESRNEDKDNVIENIDKESQEKNNIGDVNAEAAEIDRSSDLYDEPEIINVPPAKMRLRSASASAPTSRPENSPSMNNPNLNKVDEGVNPDLNIIFHSPQTKRKGRKNSLCTYCRRHLENPQEPKINGNVEIPVSCSPCRAKYSNLNILIKNCFREKKFVCGSCFNVFSSRSTLVTHFQRHTGEFKWKVNSKLEKTEEDSPVVEPVPTSNRTQTERDSGNETDH